jgi:hypothetical protein
MDIGYKNFKEVTKLLKDSGHSKGFFQCVIEIKNGGERDG